MSDTTRDPIDIRAIVARIDRDIAEAAKFAVEQHKLAAEQNKLWSEQAKLSAEAMKLHRDRLLSPWLIVVAMAGAVGGIIAGAAAIARLLGWIP